MSSGLLRGDMTLPLLLVCLLIFGSAPSLSTIPSLRATGGPNSDSWPTFHHDSARSGYTTDSAPTSPSILWTYQTGGQIRSSPVVDRGIVYVTPDDGYLYALNESNGFLLWRAAVGGGLQVSPVVSSDSVYAGGGYVYRINASSGQKIWGTYIGSMDYSLLVDEGRVFAGNWWSPSGLRMGVYGINASTGSIIWRYNTSRPVDLAYANGLLYTSSDNGFNGTYNPSIYALNATDGSLVWTRNETFSVNGGPAVAGDVLYAGGGPGTHSGPFLALNAETGGVIWSANVLALGPPAIAYGMVYLDGGPGIVALNQTTGSVVWSYSFRGFGSSLSAPAVANGIVFVGGGTIGEFSDPTIYAFDAKSGQLDWSIPVGVAANGSPAVAGGVVFVGADNGKLYAIGQAPSSLPLGLIVLGVGTAALFVIALMLRARRKTKRSHTIV